MVSYWMILYIGSKDVNMCVILRTAHIHFHVILVNIISHVHNISIQFFSLSMAEFCELPFSLLPHSASLTVNPEITSMFYIHDKSISLCLFIYPVQSDTFMIFLVFYRANYSKFFYVQHKLA